MPVTRKGPTNREAQQRGLTDKGLPYYMDRTCARVRNLGPGVPLMYI